MKKVIVTGGAGFIGSHLVDQLIEQNCQVTVIDNFSTGRDENLLHCKDKIQLVKADVSNLEAILPHFKDQDTVFHLAALADVVPSIVNPAQYYKSNVSGTFSVVEAARLAGVRKLVYTASSSCYGIPVSYPTKEDASIQLQYPYALTKYLGEEIALHWGKVYQLPVVSLRLFNVFGPRSRTSGTYGAVFGVFLAQKIANKRFTVVGDGEQTRDFIYVTDVAQAFIKAAQAEVQNEVFNVGSGQPQSINKLVSLLSGEKINIPKRPGEPDSTHADITKIKNLLGWNPKVSFEQGVEEILKQINCWKDAPVWTPEAISEATREWFECLGKR